MTGPSRSLRVGRLRGIVRAPEWRSRARCKFSRIKATYRLVKRIASAPGAQRSEVTARSLSQDRRSGSRHGRLRAEKSEEMLVLRIAKVYRSDRVLSGLDDVRQLVQQLEAFSCSEVAQEHRILERHTETLHHPMHQSQPLRVTDVVRNEMSMPLHLVTTGRWVSNSPINVAASRRACTSSERR